jgi:hypothetical protein
MKKITSSVLLILSLIILLQSCKSKDSGAWVNGDIDSGIRTQISDLNKKLFKGIMANDINAVKALLSPQLIKHAKKSIDTVIANSSMVYNARDYDVLDEYYTKSVYKNRLDTLLSRKDNIYDHTINFHAVNAETYASLLVSKDKPVNCLIFVVYGKYGDTWKINILQIGQYSINNKTAPDYYKEAMDNYNSGDLVDAVNMMQITSQLAEPVGSYFAYRNVNAMKGSFDKILADANDKFKFPLVIDGVSTKPQIFSLSPQIVEDIEHQGVFPMIKYRSAIKLTDTAALRVENTAIQKIIGTIFKGIDKNKDNILYQAYDQIPDEKNPNPKHYGFIQNLRLK